MGWMTAALNGSVLNRLTPLLFVLPFTQVMSAMAVENNAINLGQGFPDTDGPLEIREAASRALIDGPNQYPPMLGLPQLRAAYAAHSNRHFPGMAVQPSDVLVTSGGTEALTCSLLALLNRGDEAVLLAPCYGELLDHVADRAPVRPRPLLSSPSLSHSPIHSTLRSQILISPSSRLRAPRPAWST